MVQLLAVTDYVTSLAEAERIDGLSASVDTTALPQALVYMASNAE